MSCKMAYSWDFLLMTEGNSRAYMLIKELLHLQNTMSSKIAQRIFRLWRIKRTGNYGFLAPMFSFGQPLLYIQRGHAAKPTGCYRLPIPEVVNVASGKYSLYICCRVIFQNNVALVVYFYLPLVYRCIGFM